MPSCANKGCGKFYDNEGEECVYHPGGPVFHDALKGWSCCSKRVTDFDSFLKIPGCTTGSHSTVVKSDVKVDVAKAAEKPEKVSPKASEPETFSMQSLSLDKPKPSKPEKTPEIELFDSSEAVVEIGDRCKRPGCSKPFTGSESRDEECLFHPGAPIFHEGSKGWSCCTRKVLEFEEFLKIKGCKQGKHRFTAGVTESGPVMVDCRRDWYQTPDKVIVSIFAKKVNKAKSNVVLKEDRMEVDITFEDGTVHRFHTDLFQPIEPSQSAFEFLSTKLEIRLKKGNGISWAAIEPTTVKTWTTFGLQGTTGTVGAKEATIAGDAPLHLLSK